MKRQKIEALVVKCQKARGEISLFSKEKKNYKSDTRNQIDLDQVSNNQKLLQL